MAEKNKNDKTPLDRQLEAEKANARVATTGDPAERETVSGDGVPVGTGASFDPPVGTHEIPNDKGGPDGQEPTADLVLRAATLDKEQEQVETAEDQAEADSKNETSSKTTAARANAKTTAKS